MKATTRRDPRGNILNNGEYYSKSNRYYRFSYTDPIGTRRQISATSLTRLREKEENIFFRMRSELNQYTGGNLTLNDYFDMYMGTKNNIRRSTRDNYYYMYDKFVRPRFGCKKMSDYKYTDLLAFYNSLTQTGIKYNTLDNIQTVVYPSFEMAVRDGVIPRNPAEGAKTEIRKNSTSFACKVHPITKTEQMRFLEYCKSHSIYKKWYPMFVFMFGTGVRIGELASILWEDIDFENRLIHIKRAVIIERRASGARACVIMEPKTRAGIRTIPMLPDVERALEQVKDREDETDHEKLKIDGYTGFVFSNRDGGLVNQQSANRAIKRIVEEYNSEEASASVREKRPAQLLPHFTTHMIRHSFCSRLCEHENNIKVIQSIMGHTDVRTTMEIYAELSDERKKLSFESYGKNMGLI